MLKFGTGQITAPNDAQADGGITIQASRALTTDEAAAILDEDPETENEE
ncbi:hypothetical protein [Streptomyces sp. A0642]|nr:hypothetical protein [Streptomyces sp. A0642]